MTTMTTMTLPARERAAEEARLAALIVACRAARSPEQLALIAGALNARPEELARAISALDAQARALEAAGRDAYYGVAYLADAAEEARTLCRWMEAAHAKLPDEFTEP